MRDLFLVPVLLAVFLFGYYIMTKVDRFIAENQRLIDEENRSGQSKIRLAAESPLLLDRVAPALERCSDAEPHIAFFLSSGRAQRLLEKLLTEQVDIVLLSGAEDPRLDGQYASLLLPCGKGAEPSTALGLPVEDLEDESHIRVVWKSGLKSKDRDRVIFTLENEACRLKCSRSP